jgi:hypothetical protein
MKLVMRHGNTRYVILPDVIQTLRSAVFLEETNVNADRPETVQTPANEDAIIADVE